MNILVLGGTRFFGIHMVNALIEIGHDVTIATRGVSKDTFGNKVKRLKLDRTDPDSMKQAGIAYATDQIIDLYANGVTNVHV